MLSMAGPHGFAGGGCGGKCALSDAEREDFLHRDL